MSEFPAEIFVDPIAARRLSCQSVYRLQHLGARTFPWQEETFTELLLGHLTGVDYRIDAACPDCVPPQRCAAWRPATPAAGAGGLRLLTRPEEGGNKRRDRRGVGADFVYSVQEPTGAREVRMLIQAKRARHGAPIKAGALPAAQRADLLDAATHFGATAYYLFYAESASAHVGHVTRCVEHVSPSDTAIVIVAAHVLRRLFDEEGLRSVAPESVFAEGRTLMCLDGCTPRGGAAPIGIAGSSAFDRLLGFVQEDTPDYRPVRLTQATGAPATDPPATGRPLGDSAPGHELPTVVAVLGKRAKPPRRPPPGRVTRGGQQVRDGEILWVDLGDWVPADPAEDGPGSPSADRAPQPDDVVPADSPKPGRERAGYGWYPGISPARLRDSARMYWRLSLARAVHLRYLVAWAHGEIRAIYRIIDDSLIIHHDHEGKVSFELTELDPESPVARQVAHRTATYLAARKPGARNVVGYP
ncbi:hypothetical protein [Nocardia sp. NPDC050717]|uniref:hypothetical protein n=1 Tax=Nocardia sp. NPDC050717 TaxID=3157221 RepID=UPI0033EC495E